MNRGCFICSLHLIFSNFLFCLGNTEKVCNQLCATHVVEYLLSHLQLLFCMNIIHIHSTVQSHVTCILEYCKFFIRYNSGIMCCLCKHLIPLLNIPSHYQSSIIFVQFIKMICDFLTISLNCKICLS